MRVPSEFCKTKWQKTAFFTDKTTKMGDFTSLFEFTIVVYTKRILDSIAIG